MDVHYYTRDYVNHGVRPHGAGPVNELKEDVGLRYNQDIHSFNLMILSLVVYQSFEKVRVINFEWTKGSYLHYRRK